MTGYLRTATACRALAAPALAGTVWLAALGHPWLALLPAWAVSLLVFFGGRFHAAHRRTVAERDLPEAPTTRNRRKETTTR